MPLIDRESPFGQRVVERLTNEEIIWLTTVRPDGRPIPVPVWFYWDGDEELLTYSPPNARKLRHIEANPLVTLNFNCDEHGDDVVRIEAEARIDRDAPPAAAIAEMVEKYRTASERLGTTPERAWEEYDCVVPIRLRLTKLSGYLD